MYPTHMIVNIYTDSQCCINYFNQLKNSTSIVIHYKSSFHLNYLQWEIIFEIISALSLQVILFKILGHSKNYYNNITNNLANTGRYLHILDTCSSQLINWTCYLSWLDTIIEQPLCLFLKHIFQTYTFNHQTINFSNIQLYTITLLVDQSHI